MSEEEEDTGIISEGEGEEVLTLSIYEGTHVLVSVCVCVCVYVCDALTWCSDLQGPIALNLANHIFCNTLVHTSVSHYWAGDGESVDVTIGPTD